MMDYINGLLETRICYAMLFCLCDCNIKYVFFFGVYSTQQIIILNRKLI